MEEAAEKVAAVDISESSSPAKAPAEEAKPAVVEEAGEASGASAASSKKGPVLKERDDQREHLNLVFIGHVDAGKSTFCGQILYQTDQVDARTIEKYEKEAKEKNRDSWFLAFIMDTNEEERAKGKTVEVGRAHDFPAQAVYHLGRARPQELRAEHDCGRVPGGRRRPRHLGS